MTTETNEIVWRPTPEVAERSRIARFMRAQRIGSLAELHARSVADPEWYWDAVVRDLGVRWSRPYDRVLDGSRGVAWPVWFPGGRLNFTDNCVDRHVDAGRGAKPAIVWEGDDGQSRTLTYAELASGGQSPGQRAEDPRRRRRGSGRHLPADVAGGGDRHAGGGEDRRDLHPVLLRLRRRRRRLAPVGLRGQAPDHRRRLLPPRPGREDEGSRRRGGGSVPVGASTCWSTGASVARSRGRRGATAGGTRPSPVRAIARTALPVEADRPCLIIYTSGTTGRPKGAVLTHGGFLIKTAHDFAYCMDVGEGDRLFWLTDLGWLMGPMAITAALFHGGTAVMFEGVQDYPKPDRLWSIVERHRISVLGISPTAVRALMPHGPEHVHAHDLSSLRILGSTGEPWNPEPYRWLFENAGKARIPIINYTGGTEISGGILGCFPIAPIKPCSFAGPIPGMAAECFGDDGTPVRGQVGELVITRPWPGMTAGFWRDPQRYEETYWSRWPDVWVHGDWAYVDPDGFWYIQGRSDDTLKIAGKRLGPAEVESVLVGHPAVAESGVIGVPHEIKGEAVVCFVVLRPGNSPSESLRAELSERVAQAMGKALKPEKVLFTRDLPKTRSAKIMRRVIRATYLGKPAGDVSSLENPDAVKAIGEAS